MSIIQPTGNDPLKAAQQADVAARNVKAVGNTPKEADIAREKAAADLAELNQELAAETILGEVAAGAELAEKEKTSDAARTEVSKDEVKEEQGYLLKTKAPVKKSEAGPQKGEELAAEFQVRFHLEELKKKKRADKETAELYASIAKALGIVLRASPEKDLETVRENAEHETVAIAGHFDLHERAVMLTVDGFLGSVPTTHFTRSERVKVEKRTD